MATSPTFFDPTKVPMGRTAKATKLSGISEDPESGTVSPRSQPTSPSVSISSPPKRDPLFKENTLYGLTGKGGRKHRTRKSKKHARKTKKHLRRK